MSMSSSRSRSGCWTCKIRKKKCDDGRPICGPCSFRDITCHGYGERPQFMYDSAEQKIELEKIQKDVGESLKARRSFRVSKRTARGFMSMSAGSDMPVSQSLSAPAVAKGEQTQLSPKINSPMRPNEYLTGTTGFPIREPWPANYRSLQPLTSTHNNSTHIDELETKHHASVMFLSSLHLAADEQELSLVMNYLDNIFPLQFYFYQPSSSSIGSRGWLLALILRSKSVYFATLAFSILTQIIFRHNGETGANPQLSQQLDRFHTLAVTELQCQLEHLPEIFGAESLKTGIEILACTIQLLSIEVFRETKTFKGYKNDWEFHLDAAGTILSVIENGLSQSSDVSCPNVVADKAIPQLPSNSLHDLAALDFYMTTYVWSDIIRCACFGLKASSSHAFQYMTYLEECRIRLDRVMGCSNWAMCAVREISSLDAWKTGMQKCGTLDIPMLYRRGAIVEARLTNGLNSMKEQGIFRTTFEQDCDLITEIYAMSAQIYLAIVLWGNSPRTPAIRITTAACLTTIKALPHHLIIRIAFPFCVTGCMASDDEKNDFRMILHNVESGGFPLGVLWNSLDVMEQFWTMREEGPDQMPLPGEGGCPWTIAMERMGTKTLLI
ncbi:hypothetical protein VTL71DRAFT_7703 [Oculimacula yallundae]|uniref:Zn(2)-C6 fungal-type domain-containing protein n=1 Tax=Oculimacula yallundae TaxID=86028 RepID=A0ABR4BUV7_9HELO